MNYKLLMKSICKTVVIFLIIIGISVLIAIGMAYLMDHMDRLFNGCTEFSGYTIVGIGFICAFAVEVKNQYDRFSRKKNRGRISPPR